jgi:hypothetical protein
MPLTYDQTLFVVTLSCYIPTALLLWRSWVMKPFRLWTTFLHEFSHACAAWLCCHTVTGIEVHADEGGLTHWKGRNVECAKHAVLPAGYLGSTLWGCLILLSANDPFFARAMALALCAALFVCLGYAVCGQGSDKDGRFPLIFLSVGFIALSVEGDRTTRPISMRRLRLRLPRCCCLADGGCCSGFPTVCLLRRLGVITLLCQPSP